VEASRIGDWLFALVSADAGRRENPAKARPVEATKERRVI